MITSNIGSHISPTRGDVPVAALDASIGRHSEGMVVFFYRRSMELFMLINKSTLLLRAVVLLRQHHDGPPVWVSNRAC